MGIKLEDLLAKGYKFQGGIGPNPQFGTAGGTFPNEPKKRIRQSAKPLLNKLETEFKEWYERTTDYTVMCQAMRFRLGNSIWYKPDFTHLNAFGSLTCIEVKGPHAFRGGFENLKVAAGLYPQFAWKLWWKENGVWTRQDILP